MWPEGKGRPVGPGTGKKSDATKPKELETDRVESQNLRIDLFVFLDARRLCRE